MQKASMGELCDDLPDSLNTYVQPWGKYVWRSVELRYSLLLQLPAAVHQMDLWKNQDKWGPGSGRWAGVPPGRKRPADYEPV